MRVDALELRDFRNYKRAELPIADGVTVVCGPNGAGKTNLIEGLYFGLTGRSCRTSNEREMVRHGASVTHARVTTSGDGSGHVLEVALEPGSEKRTRVDGAQSTPAAARDARPPVAVFVPDRLELIKGAPAHRRAHLDRFVAALWPSRAETRSLYSRALGQRNALLARVRTGSVSAVQLDAWDAQLARCGFALMQDRADAGDRLRVPFAGRAEELGLHGPSELRYRPRSSAATIEELAAELATRRAQDLERGFTTHGPHRDDVVLSLGTRALRAFGSQGQQRLGLLALLFAERDVLGERGHPPLMLLDDVMSELDAERRRRLVDLIRSGGQTAITATDPEHVPGARDADVHLIMVDQGSARPAPHPVAA